LINGKTYYQVLGVLEDAEDAVIRAAYKVLAQKYHPDKFEGDSNYATTRMQEISRAYETLSDPKARSIYDQELKSQGRYESDIDGNDEEQIVSDDEENWQLACEFFPNLVKLASDLRSLRGALENQFKALLLETRRYDIASDLAEGLRRSYLKTYFGEDEEVHEFALHLLLSNRRKDALVLNKAITVMGGSVSARDLMKYVNERSDTSKGEKTRSQRLATLIIETANVSDWAICVEFLSTFDISVHVRMKGEIATLVLVGRKQRPMTVKEFVSWTKTEIAEPYLVTGVVPKGKWIFL